MSTSFPTSLDTFPTAADLADDTLATKPHSTLHGNLGDSVAALEAKVGIDSSAVTTSLDYKVANKQALDATLTALAAVTTAANKLIYATGSDTFTTTDYTAVARTFDALSTLLAQQQYLNTQTINAQTGTTYTLAATDMTKLVTYSNAGAITVTVPQDSDVTWAVGDACEGFQLGAGQVTVVAGTGATLRVSGLTAKSRAQYSRFFLQKISANTWNLAGDLAAS